MAANPTCPFVMHGARDAMTGWLPHIKEQVSAIEQAVAEQSPLAFDFAKTLVESILRATLDEHSVGYSHNDDLPRLNKLVTQNLPLLPPGASRATGVRESLRKTTGGLASTVQGIAELRNACGLASHGSGEPRPKLEVAQTLVAVQAADAIVGFLYRVRKDGQRLTRPLDFDANEDFNTYLDEAWGPTLIVGDARFRPSEVLFQMEPDTYRIHRAEFDCRDDDAVTLADEEE